MWRPKTKTAKNITSHRIPSCFFSISEVKIHNQRPNTTKILHAGLLMEGRWDRNNTREIAATAPEGNPTAEEGWKHHETSSSHAQNYYHRAGQKNSKERHSNSRTSNTQKPNHSAEVRQLGALTKSTLVNTYPKLLLRQLQLLSRNNCKYAFQRPPQPKTILFSHDFFDKKWMSNVSAGRGHQTIRM